MFTAAQVQRSSMNGDIDESQIHRDERGLARWDKNGNSLLTHSDTPPGPRPVTQNSNAKPGDNIVPWYEWDDADYNWQIANERYSLPKDYVPPSLSFAQIAKPVVTDTTATVIANSLKDRRAAGIADGDLKSDGTHTTAPAPVFRLPTAFIPPKTAPITGDANSRYLVNGALTDGTGKVLNANRPVDGGGATETRTTTGDLHAPDRAQVLPTNNTTASAVGVNWQKYAPYALGILALILLLLALRGKRST